MQNDRNCNKKGKSIDLRKGRSYADLDPNTDKLKPVKGFYNIDIIKDKSCDDKCYVKLPTKFDYKLATILQIAQKTISSNIVFVTDCCEKGLTEWYYDRMAIENDICCIPYWDLSFSDTYAFITEDLVGEDARLPKRIVEKMKALKDEAHKKQSRSSLFEAFMLPGLRDVEGITYNTDYKTFCIKPEDVQDLLEKHIKEVIIPKFEEVGAHLNIYDFNLGSLKYSCDIPLEKVKLDNIDDIE